MNSAKTDKKQRAAVAREAARVKAFAHPLRHRIFIRLAERLASPTELAEELGEPRYIVAYHVRFLAGTLKKGPDALKKWPLIELVETDRRRGGVQHFYKAIEQPKATMETAAGQSRAVRENISAAIIPLIVEDLATAQREGTVDEDEQRSLMRSHHRLDRQARLRTAELVEAHQQALEDVAAESANREAAGGEEGMSVATATLVYPLPRLYSARKS